MENCTLVPIITDKPPAPDELLKNIRCLCKRATNICKSCSCNRMRLSCSVHCKCHGECDNGVVLTPTLDEDNDDEDFDEDNDEAIDETIEYE